MLANSLARKGLYGNSHGGFLQVYDAALTSGHSSEFVIDPKTDAQLQAGFGPGALHSIDSVHLLKEVHSIS